MGVGVRRRRMVILGLVKPARVNVLNRETLKGDGARECVPVGVFVWVWWVSQTMPIRVHGM